MENLLRNLKTTFEAFVKDENHLLIQELLIRKDLN